MKPGSSSRLLALLKVASLTLALAQGLTREEARLLDRLAEVLAEGVEGIAPVVAETGEARWALQEALERRVSLPVIAQALFARLESQDPERLRFRVLAALRHAFGGHPVAREKKGGQG
ncbi:hypothetical protein [Thermus sp.]|uniref:hypothetical protein n=1 Tax=Thermus sp. TaxID=275 RepID=UPI003D0E960D